jgi:tyrosyl-tRNA synthetase
LVSQLYGNAVARQAEEEFTNVFQKREVPEDIQEYAVSFHELETDNACIDIGKLLAATGLVKSRTEANRLISQGAISIEGVKVTGPVAPLKSGNIIKVGKHRFVKIINKEE